MVKGSVMCANGDGKKFDMDSILTNTLLFLNGYYA
jgi:hypothetical protein